MFEYAWNFRNPPKFFLVLSVLTRLWRPFVQTIKLHYASRKYGKNVGFLLYSNCCNQKDVKLSLEL